MDPSTNNSNNFIINNSSRPNTTSTAGDVYIIPGLFTFSEFVYNYWDVYTIPDYNTTRTSHPAQILVLPFVPHPSNTITNVNVPAPAQIQPAPPPHYFYTGKQRALF